MRAQILANLHDAQTALRNLMSNDEAVTAIEAAATTIVGSLSAGGRIYSCGNGGSMCDAMHFAEELSGRFREDRPSMPATAISDPSYISCVANDYGYDRVFARYIQGHGRAGDTLFAISTSGSSASVVNAAEAAKQLNMHVIALTGRKASALEKCSNHCICTPAGRYADRVQELHIKVIHILIELIERNFYPENFDNADHA